MPKVAGPPLRKVTLNLFDSDVEWFQQRYGQGYTERIRDLVRAAVEGESLREGNFEWPTK